MEFQCIEDRAQNAPLPENKLIDLIETCYVTSKNETKSDQNAILVERFLKYILEQLNKHSSLYKYIVSMTCLKSLVDEEDSDSVDGNFTMINSVGTSWNPKKDGLFNYTVRSAERPRQQFLVTIIWVYK
ncbi:hypothetical protein HG535_0E03410 [Zygotorulaspora mrakii]|uniref:Topoisomerase I damage affected protein 2 n=1 Tax=Zygotorulaspora mrakii TaxID=42260 RepID=A0A7H9B417_ZYGMR|nr:uncharacterized protein HG535_0E03410 [Zygotorulaspora mrakii]QLG73257.1 hypothetical protein HG535_0E03410 [Zygotorulaspora mrakii]